HIFLNSLSVFAFAQISHKSVCTVACQLPSNPLPRAQQQRYSTTPQIHAPPCSSSQSLSLSLADSSSPLVTCSHTHGIVCGRIRGF
ncbi:hypothetical protein SDJN02_18400, partial [Cucurbita argyrosperma subsp. argyrosperma]